jgi:alpha-tubulin suppressor-like RCC1 family protein
MAIRSDGTLWGWGKNPNGRLGLGDTTSRSSPTQVGALTNWTVIKSHYGYGAGPTIAIKSDGTMWTWGGNAYGQLGLGDTANRSSPVQVGSLTNWYSCTISNRGSLAVKTDGTLWSWGQNYFGNLGLGVATYYSSPKQVGALTDWININGSLNPVSVKANGTLWGWGRNNDGQLGLGDATSRSSPTQIGALTNWAYATSGRQGQTFAVKTDGTLWSWGRNYSGSLGHGNSTDYNSPKQIGALTDWSRVSTSRFNVHAIKTNGTLWSWGANYNGMLGLGNTTQYNSPKQVGSLTTWTVLSLPPSTDDAMAALQSA